MITSKQRAHLRSIANAIEPIMIIGKDGIDDNVIKQAEDAIKAREIIKISILKNSDASISPRSACNLICEKIGAEPVQVIGNKFIIYKKSEENPKIIL